MFQKVLKWAGTKDDWDFIIEPTGAMLGMTPSPVAVDGVVEFLDEELGDFTYPGTEDVNDLQPIEVDITSSI